MGDLRGGHASKAENDFPEGECVLRDRQPRFSGCSRFENPEGFSVIGISA